MIRAVIDTNILVSGLISALGNEALVLLAVHHARPKFGFPADEIAALLGMVQRNGELFEPGDAPATSPDPGDTKFLQCALAADADVIVTGNRRHFPDAPYGATQVVSAGELLGRITFDA